MWYISTAANQSPGPRGLAPLSYFDCKELYEKAYACKKETRSAIRAFADWRREDRRITDAVARESSARLGRLLRAQARLDVAKFRRILGEAEAAADAYRQQMAAPPLARAA